MGLGTGQFHFVPNSNAGFSIGGAIRNVEEVRIGSKNVLIFTRNNRETYLIEYSGHQ